MYGPLEPLSPVLAPVDPLPGAISGGGCAVVGMFGDVGDTCEFRSLFGPTFPGRTARSSIPLSVEPDTACAVSDKRKAKAVAICLYRMMSPPNAPQGTPQTPTRQSERPVRSREDEPGAFPQIGPTLLGLNVAAVTTLRAARWPGSKLSELFVA